MLKKSIMKKNNKTIAYYVIILTYIIYLFIFNFLTFPVKEDEPHFWRTALTFSHSLIPTLEQMSDYNDLNTPLPFIVFGQLEFLTGNGIILGRYLNLLLSFGMLCFIIRSAKNNTKYAIFLILPLLVNPYLILTSTYLYTDILAIFFVFTGLLFYLKKNFFLSAFLFFLGISSRQYMLAFPLALLVFSILLTIQKQKTLHFFDLINSFFNTKAIYAMFFASVSIVIWFFLFGGFGPKTALARQTVLTTGNFFFVRNTLFFLSSVGIYFVLPEFILFNKKVWAHISPLLKKRSLYFSLIALIFLFILFPPIANLADIQRFGIVDWILRLLHFPDFLRVIIYCGFAMMTMIRFFKLNLASILVFVNALLMLKAHVAWEKYTLPLIVILFLLKALDKIDSSDLNIKTITQNIKMAFSESAVK